MSIKQLEIDQQCPNCLERLQKKRPNRQVYAPILKDQSTTSPEYRQKKCLTCGYSEPYKVLL